MQVIETYGFKNELKSSFSKRNVWLSDIALNETTGQESSLCSWSDTRYLYEC